MSTHSTDSIAAPGSAWRPIETGPRDGSSFLAYQDGEIFVAKYTTESQPRLCRRVHELDTKRQYRCVVAEMDGEPAEALVPINQPWEEEYRHDWSLWSRGFDFKPTHWAPAPTGGFS